MPIFLGKIQLQTSPPCLQQAKSSPSNLTEDLLSKVLSDKETNRGLESPDTTGTSLQEPRMPKASRSVPAEADSSQAWKQALRFTISVKSTPLRYFGLCLTSPHRVLAHAELHRTLVPVMTFSFKPYFRTFWKCWKAPAWQDRSPLLMPNLPPGP